jgi:hypothetical protein
MKRARRYDFKNLMDRLTSDCWFVIKEKDKEVYFFAQMVI